MMFLLKVVICFAGLAFSLYYLVSGLSGDIKALKKAAVVFGLTWVLLVLISVAEYLIFI